MTTGPYIKLSAIAGGPVWVNAAYVRFVRETPNGTGVYFSETTEHGLLVTETAEQVIQEIEARDRHLVLAAR
jgi:uncharacterized protein YlzI (FlbEa/FlbD family)